jgi:hypothetical protein
VFTLADLERDLYALGDWVEWPQTPRFAITRAAGQAPPMRPSRWLLAAAAVILAAVLVLAASPPVRDTVAGWLGLRGVVIQKVEHPPTPSPLPPGPLGQRLGLGEQVTLADAESRAGFKVLLPARLGQPDEIYYDSSHRMVSLVYASRPGLPAPDETGVSLLVSEFPGQLVQDSFSKILGQGQTLDEVDLGSGKAYYIGGQHVFYFFNGPGRTDESRLAANTLIWQRDDVLIRMEGRFTKDQSAEIARSLR